MAPYQYNMIVVTGPTATGKTSFAAGLASRLDGEIISADSRQVYRGMDIGTGKDYNDYIVNGNKVPYHLIDIVDAGYKYNVFEYQRDFMDVYNDVTARNKFPVLCGGTGLYIDSVLRGYRLLKVPVNEALRNKLEPLSLPELRIILEKYRKLHNVSDVDTKKRAIRAIEIEEYYKNNSDSGEQFPSISTLVTAISFDRNTRRSRISERLKARLDEGMLDEVKRLLEKGLTPDDLIYYGLEYKFITLYLTGALSYEDMFRKLETAIHQFSKRQMTWFRGMERRGVRIHWLDGNLDAGSRIDQVLSLLNKQIIL